MRKCFSLSALLILCMTLLAFAEEPPPRGQSAVVNITTNPPGSQVFLGGEDLGKSPITNRSVQSGRQTLVVIDQGYELVNQRVNIWPGSDKRNNLDFGTTIPKGSIKITTIPGKCQIYIDGDLADYTDGAPLTVKSLDAGDHMVRAECGGKKNGEALVTVKGEETVEVTIDASGKKKK